MDLALGAKETFVMMTLFARDGSSKIVRKSTNPLTGVACVNRVYTDVAVFHITDAGLVVRDLFNVTFERLDELIGVPLLDGTSR